MNPKGQAAPAGTITMLFTDIEGSTNLARALGTDRWEAVLERETGIIREALAKNGGLEARTEGDSVFAVFTSAAKAISAAAAMQQGIARAKWPDKVTLRVRVGLHTGETRPASAAAGADYVGFEVHRAARVAGAAHGGPVLVSDATAGLVRDALPQGFSLIDLGRHRLKDLEPQRLYQLAGEGLAASSHRFGASTRSPTTSRR